MAFIALEESLALYYPNLGMDEKGINPPSPLPSKGEEITGIPYGFPLAWE